MIVFLGAMKHPANCRSAERVAALLQQTLNSIAAQSDQNYRAIIVCNERPAVDLPDPARMEYLVVDFPRPKTGRGLTTCRSEVRRDKGSKAFAGLLKAAEYNPDYLMLFDTDDYLHRDLAAFLNAHPDQWGWYVEEGYVARHCGCLLSPLSNFHRHCGSSVILSWAVVEPHLGVLERCDQEEIVSQVDEHFLFMILGSHYQTVDHFQERGTPLLPIPFPAAVWLVDTGENQSQARLFGVPRPVRTKLAESFSFPRSASPGAALYEGCMYWLGRARGELLRRLERTRLMSVFTIITLSRPIFVLGCRGSGEGVFLDTLAENASIHYVGESDVFRRPGLRAKLSCFFSWNREARALGKQAWAVYLPDQAAYFKELFSYFPKARVIYLHGDPHKVAEAARKREYDYRGGRLRWEAETEAAEPYWSRPGVRVVRLDALI